MSDLERMKELVEQLDAAARAYYQESKELMSNKEYDELYDELAALEKKTGTKVIILLPFRIEKVN